MKNKTNNTQQAFWIALGGLFSFGFGIVSSMILSRYFDKSDYGTYKQVLYVYSTLLTVFTLGLPRAFSYFLPRVEINEAKHLIKKITNIFFILGGVFSIILFLFSPFIAKLLNNADLELALKIFSPVPFLMLPTMGLEGILSTFRRTKFMAVYTITTRMMMLVCVALPVMFWGGDYIQAIIGFTIASFISFVLALYLKYLPVRKEGNDKSAISYSEIFKFSLPLLYASLWGMLISSADQFFISRYFGNQVFADFSNGSLELPFVGMILGAGTFVLSPIFSKQIHEKSDVRTVILPLWLSAFEKSVKIIYPLVLFFWFFATTTMTVLYGNIYAASGEFFKIKLIVNLFTLITYGPMVISIGATKYYAKVHMYGAIALIILEYVSILVFNSPTMIVWISVLCQIGRIFALLLYLSKYFNLRLIELFPLKLISKILFPSILMLLLIRYVYSFVLYIEGLPLILYAFITYLIMYLLWSKIIKIDNWSIIKPLFNRFI